MRRWVWVLIVGVVFTGAGTAAAHPTVLLCSQVCEPEWANIYDNQATVYNTRPVIHLAPQPSMGSNTEQWRTLVETYFPAETVDTMLCLMGYESGGNPNAQNPNSSAAGLFQIMEFWQADYPGDYYDPETNVSVAKKIYDRQGYGAWNPYNNGHCR